MLLILEFAMLGVGLYALVIGKAPAFIIGGSQYQVRNTPARLIGLIMMMPFPGALVTAIIIGILYAVNGGVTSAEDAQAMASGSEIILVLGAAVSSRVLFHVYRQTNIVVGEAGNPAPLMSNLEAEIGRKVDGSLTYLALGGLGLTALVLCPLAYIRTTKAIRMIDEHHVGEQFRGRANTIRTLSLVVLFCWIGLGVWVIGSLALSS